MVWAIQITLCMIRKVVLSLTKDILLGPIVRITPYEYSIDDPEAVKPIYGHGTQFIKVRPFSSRFNFLQMLNNFRAPGITLQPRLALSTKAYSLIRISTTTLQTGERLHPCTLRAICYKWKFVLLNAQMPS